MPRYPNITWQLTLMKSSLEKRDMRCLIISWLLLMLYMNFGLFEQPLLQLVLISMHIYFNFFCLKFESPNFIIDYELMHECKTQLETKYFFLQIIILNCLVIYWRCKQSAFHSWIPNGYPRQVNLYNTILFSLSPPTFFLQQNYY